MCSLFIEQAEALFPSIHRLRVQFKNAWFVAEVVMGQKGTNTNPPPEEVTKATTQIPQHTVSVGNLRSFLHNG